VTSRQVDRTASTPGGAQVCLGLPAGPLRRQLEPTGWTVLEELVLRATEARVSCGVRAIAVALGLDKDTVARALRRLRAAGLVELLGPGAYRVRVDRCHGLTLHSAGDRASGCPEERDSRNRPGVGDGMGPAPIAIEADRDGCAKGEVRLAAWQAEPVVESKPRRGSRQYSSRTATPPSSQPSLFDFPRPTSPAP
jgi:hypothetical protein